MLPYLVAGGLYGLASVVVWWHVWTSHPSGVMTCACTDAGRTAWYVEWVTYALTHGHDLLFSTWMLHPGGVNLLADTSVPAIGLVLVPVTSLFGPVVAVNLAGTLIPVTSGLTMFWLLRRWVRWAPAAFVGGLLYGFSAFVVVQLAFGWLNLACTALLPLVAGCLDELLIRQRVRPTRVGVALALLATVQFFVSSELLLIGVLAGVVAVVLLAAYDAVRDPRDLRRRLPHAATGLGVALVVGAVLLAYPLWFFLAGPAHLGTTVWSTDVPGNLGNVVGNFWTTLDRFGPINGRTLAQEAPVLGGYRGPAPPSPSYLGIGMPVVLAVGTAIWRRDRRLWLFGALGLVAAVLSLRAGGGRWGPWGLVDHLPLVRNVVQSRFSAVVDLCAAAMLAIIVDRVRSSTSGRGGSLAAGLVAVVALGSTVAALAPNIPLTVQPVAIPSWFQGTADHLGSGQVLLTYPFATADSQAAVPWQAVDRMRYQMAGGGGPGATVARAGPQRAGFAVLRDASVILLPAPDLTVAHLDAVREAVRAWGVTRVVVPDDAGLPRYETGRGTAYGVAFFTAVFGSLPERQDGAWVWSTTAPSGPPRAISGEALGACLAGPSPPATVGPCVLRGGPVASGPG